MGRIYSIGDRNSDEDKLWEKFLGGDLDAWEKIFELYYVDLYGYGLKLSSHKELTKDCIHELFVTIWDRKENIAEVDSVKAYLLASLRRSLLKKMKKKRKYYEDKSNFKNYSYKIQSSTESKLIRNQKKAEKLEEFYEAIDQLPDRQKEILFLKYFNGMTYDEMEDILSIKYQSIKNHVYRALSRLREVLGEDRNNRAL